MTCSIGDNAPNFELPCDNGDTISLQDFKGQMLVLYFYPKDDTPGCTKQACGFSDNLQALNKINAAVVGVSKDSVEKHEKFKQKYNLAFPLASDENSDVCERYDVWKEKNMYGKKFMGIERSTFLIDGNGVIQHVWRKVKVDGHIEDVKAAIEDLNKKAA